jgi:hypothetical protein
MRFSPEVLALGNRNGSIRREVELRGDSGVGTERDNVAVIGGNVVGVPGKWPVGSPPVVIFISC